MFLNVQRVEVDWGKNARGGKLATLRNSFPEILEIKDNDRFYYKENGICMMNNFSSYQPKLGEKLIFESGYALCEMKENNLEVYYFGPPEHHIKKLITLKPNSWVQIKYNGIYPLEYTWRYKKVVLNIQFGDKSSLPSDYYFANKPLLSISKRLKVKNNLNKK